MCEARTESLETGSSSRARIASVVLTIAIFSGLSLTCAVLSDGFATADACAHYLYARFALSDPVNLVDVWARPLCTMIDALPAHWGGRLGVRITSLLIALGCGLFAWRIAKGQGQRRPELALALTLASPLLFIHSFSEMTELPFALLLGGAFLAWQDRRWMLAALLTGLTPAARPEGLGFLLLAAGGLLIKRKWWAVPVLLIPLLAWDVAGWLLMDWSGHWWLWLYHAWPWTLHGLYGRGNILSFAAALPLVVSPLVLPATLIGIGRSLSSGAIPRETGDASGFDSHLRACRILIALIPLAVLVVHSILRALGRFGSFGEPRYLLIAAPFWGVLSTRGWEWVFDRMGWRRPLLWAGAAALFPIAINAMHPVAPIHLDENLRTARSLAQWYKSSPLRKEYPLVIASHPGIYYFLDENPSGVARQGGFTRGTIDHPPPGALLVWDPIFSPRNANIEETASVAQITRAGWLSDPQLDQKLEHSWHVFLSPRPAQ